MEIYRVTMDTRKGDIKDIEIKCDNDINACWQAYEIARRFDAKLINVSK